jgi:hypothetical protein
MLSTVCRLHMRKPILIIVVAVASAGIAQPQSGRRIATPASAPIAPIQPPANPEPELKPTTAEVLPELPMLTERLREREIKSLDNSTFRLSDFTGKVVVINIWRHGVVLVGGKCLSMRRCAKSTPVELSSLLV